VTGQVQILKDIFFPYFIGIYRDQICCAKWIWYFSLICYIG